MNQRQIPSRGVERKLFRMYVIGLAIAVCATFMAPRTSRGDHIDEELIKQAPHLVKILQDKGYKSVGVLKFIVKPGKGAANSNAGPLNLVMATRVENALIHGASPSSHLSVVRNATQVAANADPKFTMQTAAGRKGLFTRTYPLAWGTDKVTPDAFITGNVALSEDMRKTVVSIYCFDKSGDGPAKILSFEVPTDRNILAESGRSFVINRRGLKTRSIDELDASAVDSAVAADAGKPITQQATGDMPIKFEIRYNGIPQAITQDPGSFGEMRVDPPQKGDTVVFHVTNVTKEKAKIALVVKVNGESTMGQETAEDADCQKWTLVPDKEFGLSGFYNVADNKVTRFKVLDDDESAARMAEWSGSRPRAGYIDVTVFTEGPVDVPPVVKGDDGTEELMAGRSLRGLHATHRPKNYLEARNLVDVHAGKPRRVKRLDRGLVVAGDNQEDANLSPPDSIPNPTSSFQLQINYYKPAGG